MRSAERIRRTPGEWADHQAAQRRKLLAELLRELERANGHNAPWYVWVRARADRVHLHDLHDERGRPVECPVPECREAPAAW